MTRETLAAIKEEEHELGCSLCSHALVVVGMRPLADIEYEADPNRHVSNVEAYGCTNRYCPASRLDWVWNWYGVIFTNREYYLYNYLKFIDGISAALHSVAREYEEKVRREKTSTHTFKTKWLRIDVKFYPRFALTFWRRVGDGTYIMVFPRFAIAKMLYKLHVPPREAMHVGDRPHLGYGRLRAHGLFTFPLPYDFARKGRER